MSRLGELGHKLYSGEVSYDIVGKRRRWYTISAAMVAVAILSLVVRGLNFGIEFTGGAEFQVPSASCSLDTASAAVESAGVPARTVAVELTETTRPAAADQSTAGLDTLREHGLALWLDDFGAGYYDLRDLIRLPLDGIKFDRTFTGQLALPRTAPLLGALTAAAHQMGMRVTLEGIETSAQASAGRELDCDLGQGFLWSQPVPAEQVESWFGPASA